jgi:putative NADPH-quinone reductase
MKTLVLVFHPDLSASRVNRRWAEEMEKHDGVTVHRVYEAYPDWQIDVAAEQRLVDKHDRIVLQFPIHWYSTPPLLKKWQDEVLLPGWAIGSQGGMLHNKELMLAITVGTAEEGYSASGSVGYTVQELLYPFRATSNKIGTRYLPPFIVHNASVYSTPAMTDEQIEASAKEYVTYALEPEIAPLVAR